jgi:hypothetical protein
MPGLYALQSGQLHERNGAVGVPLNASKGNGRDISPLVFEDIPLRFFTPLNFAQAGAWPKSGNMDLLLKIK